MDMNTLTLADLLPPEWGQPSFEPFEPCAVYSAPMDCVIYLQEDVSVRADRIDQFLTILWHPQEHKVVGFKIKSISFLFETLQSAVKAVTGKDIPDDSFISVVGTLEFALKMHAGAALSEKCQIEREDGLSNLNKSYEIARGLAVGVNFNAGELVREHC